MSDWQPIATAKKVGPPGILTFNGTRVDIARWNKDAFSRKSKPYWQYIRSHSPNCDRANPPTHWMPLPPPPPQEPTR
jgi:hypothetical protein